MFLVPDIHCISTCILCSGNCPSDWTKTGGTCFSPPRKTHEWTDSTDGNTNCDEIEKLCTDDDATLATKEQTQAWLDNGGDDLGMPFGLTSTKDGHEYWFTGYSSMHGYHIGNCHKANRFFVCAKPGGMI